MSGALEVLDAGLFTTVQDLGRQGHARLGVSAAGAADPVAFVVANRLAGNPDGAPALEMTLRGGRFRFETAAYVAVAGADMQAAIDGRPLPSWSAAPVAAGATLSCGAMAAGARAVLAVRGGLVVPPVLGSASTHVPSALGGLEGRALRAGDRLGIGDLSRPIGASPDVGALPRGPEPPLSPRRVDPLLRDALAPAAGVVVTLRVAPAAATERFDAAARRVLVESEYRVSAASDRMGVRLEGPAIPEPAGGSMLTEGMPLMALQVPPGGQPVILFVDHQTTGGYPVIAVVASADQPAVAQLRPGARLRFALVGFDEARRLLRRRDETLEAASRFVP
jgi:antagonist of KipI